MSWTDFIVDKVLPAGVTGVGAALTAVWKSWAQLNKRIESLETNLKSLSENMRDAEENALKKRDEILSSCKNDIQANSVSLNNRLIVLEQRAKDIRDVTKQVDSLESELQKLRHLPEEVGTLSESFSSFVKDQGNQWKVIERTLGRIEGVLTQRYKSSPSEEFQSPLNPRREK